MPAGLALGICIGARHDDRATLRQARRTAGNAEIPGWAELVGRARQDARNQLAAMRRRAQAAAMQASPGRAGARRALTAGPGATLDRKGP